MSRRSKGAAVVLLCYSVVLAVALLAPTSSVQSGMVGWLASRLAPLEPVPGLVSYGRLEVLMNVVIVAPVSFLGSLWRPRLSWRDWTALGFVGSGLVELVQGVLLPARQAAYSDVVANTAGALVGALLALLVTRLLVRSRS